MEDVWAVVKRLTIMTVDMEIFVQKVEVGRKRNGPTRWITVPKTFLARHIPIHCPVREFYKEAGLG